MKLFIILRPGLGNKCKFVWKIMTMHKKEILSRINSIVSNISRISRNEQSMLHVLETDLLKKYCLEMYDLLLQVDQAAETVQGTDSEEAASGENQQDIFSTEAPFAFSAPVTEPELVTVPGPEEDAVAELTEEVKPEPELISWLQVPAEPEAESEPEAVPESEPEPEPEPELNVEVPLAEVETEPVPPVETPLSKQPEPQPEWGLNLHSRLMEEEELTLNDKISQTLEKKALVESMMHTPIDDLKTHIALNKKVAFIIGLFNEESEAYNSAIDYMNAAPDLNTALDYYHSCKKKYGWSAGSELAADLEALVRRRHQPA